MPVRNSFKLPGTDNSISRIQLPLVPAYAYTDYKSQGRTLDVAILDLASAGSLQGAYVMLSRVKELEGVAILQWFPPRKIDQRLSEEMRDELQRLQNLHVATMEDYDSGNI